MRKSERQEGRWEAIFVDGCIYVFCAKGNHFVTHVDYESLTWFYSNIILRFIICTSGSRIYISFGTTPYYLAPIVLCYRWLFSSVADKKQIEKIIKRSKTKLYHGTKRVSVVLVLLERKMQYFRNEIARCTSSNIAVGKNRATSLEPSTGKRFEHLSRERERERERKGPLLWSHFTNHTQSCSKHCRDPPQQRYRTSPLRNKNKPGCKIHSCILFSIYV